MLLVQQVRRAAGGGGRGGIEEGEGGVRIAGGYRVCECVEGRVILSGTAEGG